MHPRLSGIVVLLLLMGCVSIAGGPGGISPSQFKFVPVVPAEGGQVGGWKAARVVITLVRGPEEPTAVPCELSVEVPAINEQGEVTDGFAQRAAAMASDEAAARVAGQGLLSAELCERFRQEMMRELGLLIPGARVRRARNWGRP
jgi:hypothetical protein